MMIVLPIAGIAVLVGLAVLCVRNKKATRRVTSPGFGDGKAGNKYKYGGKGRIPDFDPDAEAKAATPFSPFGEKSSVNPLAGQRESLFMNPVSPNNSETSAPKEQTSQSTAADEFDSGRRNTNYIRPKSGTSDSRPQTNYDALPPPLIVNKGDGMIKVDAMLGPTEPLGITTRPRENLRGICIATVARGSAAERIGAFHSGDVLLSINGRDVLNASHEAVQLALEVCGKIISFELLTEKKPAMERQVTREKEADADADADAIIPELAVTKDVEGRREKLPSVRAGTFVTGIESGGSNTEGPISNTTLRKHGGLFEEGLLSESPKMGRKSMPGLDKQGSKLEMNRSSGPHEAETDGDEILEAMRLDKERRMKEAGSDASGAAAAAAASTTIATTDIDKAAGVLAKRRAEGRAVPAAPASAADVPELDEAAKSRLLTPSGSSHSLQSKMKVLGDGANTAKSVKRKRTKTIKKEAGKLLVRLKQLVDGIDNPEDLPDYSVVRTSLIEEFGNEFFKNNQQYVMNWLRQIGMSKFDVQSSSDPTPDGMATISRRNRPKSMHSNKMGEMFKKRKVRTATGWFKEVPSDGKKKRKRYCEMKGTEIKMFEKIKRAIILRDTITISDTSHIQRHGYELFIANEDTKWTLQAESEEQCQEWHGELRATYIELCEKIDLDAFQAEAPAPAPVATPESSAGSPSKPAMFSIGGLEDSGGGGGGAPAAAAAAAPAPAPVADVTTAPGLPAAPETPKAPAVVLTPEQKAEERAVKKAALAAKRAAAKAARTAGNDTALTDIFAWIDALDDDKDLGDWPGMNLNWPPLIDWSSMLKEWAAAEPAAEEAAAATTAEPAVEEAAAPAAETDTANTAEMPAAGAGAEAEADNGEDEDL